MRIAILAVALSLPACLPSTDLTVTKSGAGSGTVKSDPFGIECGDQCTMHMDAEGVVELTAIPEMGHAFRGWSGDCSGAGKCTIDSSFSAEVDARFEVVSTVTVQMTGAGVDVVSNPPGLVCTDGTCTGEFARGTDVTLSFAQIPSLHFDGWSGACRGHRLVMHGAISRCADLYAAGGFVACSVSRSRRRATAISSECRSASCHCSRRLRGARAGRRQPRCKRSAARWR